MPRKTSSPTVAKKGTTPAEEQDIRRVRGELTKLRRRRRFIDYAESSAYARQLASFVHDLGASVTTPEAGVQLLAEFLRADARILEACDDSNGTIGDVFRVEVAELFVRYGRDVADKEWLADLVFDLVRDDGYGVRDSILQAAAQYLPADTLRYLANRLLTAAQEERAREPATPRFRSSIFRPGNTEFMLAEMVATQLKDPELVEFTRRQSDPALGIASCIAIGRAWLEAGHADVSLSWAQRIPTDGAFMAEERDDLLRDAHASLGNHDEVERLTWKRFREQRNGDTFDRVLAIVGEHHRDVALSAEAEVILAADSFVPNDAIFLIESGLVDLAARYVETRPHLIDGRNHELLRPIGKALRRTEHALAASVVTRSLLDAILARAYSPAYRYAGRYLRDLDALSGQVREWATILPHDAYVRQLREAHGRKWSFWKCYEGATTAR